jgi:ectoine hydroxylase-related dioxygenase (phytanoyl-CoA dioxygenase family)
MEPSSQQTDHLSPYLQGRPLAAWRDEFDTRGFVIFEKVLPPAHVARIRAALAPYLESGKKGRNDFEGLRTNRVYALLAKSSVFAELAIHPLVLAFAEAELGPDCLLSACLAINLHTGETVQPWHYDDGEIQTPRPRPAFGMSAFWAIDDTTEINGATEVIPGSHLWGPERIDGAVKPADFANDALRSVEDDPGARADAVKMTMSAGSLAIAKGTLWHRGGANKSSEPRLIVTPQYCAGWVRQLENMTLAVPPELAAGLPERACELLGYSIHPPFMGYVDGVHPKRLLTKARSASAKSRSA